MVSYDDIYIYTLYIYMMMIYIYSSLNICFIVLLFFHETNNLVHCLQIVFIAIDFEGAQKPSGVLPLDGFLLMISEETRGKYCYLLNLG